MTLLPCIFLGLLVWVAVSALLILPLSRFFAASKDNNDNEQ